MTLHTVNTAGDKHEFDPERWTTSGQNGVTNHQNGTSAHTRLPDRHPETGIDILIIGAGMGGLMTALECWRKGHNIAGIFERSAGPVYSGLRRSQYPCTRRQVAYRE